MAIIAHELGHVGGYHIWILILVNASPLILTLGILMAISSAGPDFYAAFGWNKVRDTSVFVSFIISLAFTDRILTFNSNNYK